MDDDLKRAIVALDRNDRPALIALSGFSGSGKSTLAIELAKGLSGSQVVESDVFWLPEYNRLSSDWSSIDRLRIREEVLLPARAGLPVVYTPYDWENERMGDPVAVPECRRIIVEGIGILHPDIAEMFDLKVWLDAPFERAMEAGMRRDRETYGLDNAAEWREVWIPNERAYFERFRPDLMADIVVTWFGA